MRILVRSAIAVLAVLIMTGGFGLAGASRWSAEARVAGLVPIGTDGDLDVDAGLGDAGRHEIDALRAVSLELATSLAVTRRFGLGLTVGYAPVDIELDVDGAGEIPLGESDAILVQLAGLFDLATIRGSRLAAGPVLAYAAFDDASVDPPARARAGVTQASLDSSALFGVEARLDTPIGSRGWYFSSALRWLAGGPDLEVFTDADGSGPGTSGRVLAGAGSVDFDPLIVSLGFGRRF